ncbi:MAG: thioredoxin family protein [Synergistaceae bacterium]|nr:thioredoxin family protein [Synergistaceae bacterium]
MSAKKVIAFYLEGCPYCSMARKAVDELKSEMPEKYSQVEIEWVEENQHPEISAQYDYYYVPAMFVDGKKMYEAFPGTDYKTCWRNVNRVLHSAVS